MLLDPSPAYRDSDELDAELVPRYSPAAPIASSSSALPTSTRSAQTTFDLKECRVVFHSPGDAKSVWLNSGRAGAHGAMLEGEVILPAGSDWRAVVVGLRGVIEYHRIDNRRTPTAIDRELDEKAHYQVAYNKCLSWRFTSDEQTLAPLDRTPFKLKLPSTYPSEIVPGKPLPPSCAMAEHGVRYFVKVKLISRSGLFSSQKSVRHYVPVIYVPLHSIESWPGARLLARRTKDPLPPPGRTKELWTVREGEMMDGGFGLSVWVPKPAQLVRGEEVELYVRLDCPTASGGFPLERLRAELRVSQEWIHLDEDLLATATLTPVDSSLLPALPEDLTETYQPACFRGVIHIPGTACPSFKVRQLQQTHSLRLTFSPPSTTHQASTSSSIPATGPLELRVPVVIVNVENGVPYLIPGKYCNADEKGPMLMQGKDAIECM